MKRLKLFDCFTDFGKGFIAGFLISVIIFGILAGLMYRHRKDRELIEYAERQIEIQELREDYVNRDPLEFLEDHGVRGAANDAIDEFQRRMDEALHRFRNRLVD